MLAGRPYIAEQGLFDFSWRCFVGLPAWCIHHDLDCGAPACSELLVQLVPLRCCQLKEAAKVRTRKKLPRTASGVSVSEIHRRRPDEFWNRPDDSSRRAPQEAGDRQRSASGRGLVTTDSVENDAIARDVFAIGPKLTGRW